MVSKINNHTGTKILKPIIGVFSPYYINGTIKIQKDCNALRPIMSQIHAPIYDIAKQLNNIIAPYIPSKYIIHSTENFLYILQVLRPSGIIASLDVESLFTNFPVLATIDIICNIIYNQNTLLPPPNIDCTQLS